MKAILLGPPGAGKGTIAKALMQLDGSVQISTGDILRSAIAEGSELGKRVEAAMAAGDLVTDSLIMDIMEQRLLQDDCKQGYLLDGFPRTMSQAESLDTFLTDKGTPVTVVLSLEVPDEEVTTRLINRAKDSGRSDDADPAIIANRLDVYKEQTFPCLDYFDPSGKVHRIDGVGDIDAIFAALCEAIDGVHA